MYSLSEKNSSDCFCGNNNNIGDSSNKVMKKTAVRTHDVRSLKKTRKCVNDNEKEVKKEEVMAIRTRFPNKVPIIVHKYWKDNQLPQLDKSKYLVPEDITMSQFQSIIRSRMKMSQTQALYLLVNDTSMLSLSLTIGEIYSEYAGSNGFLYITYASQEVFGNNQINNSYEDKQNSNEIVHQSL